MEHDTHSPHAVHTTASHVPHAHHRRLSRRMKQAIVIAVTLIAVAGGYVGYFGNPFAYTYPADLPEQLREKTHAPVALVNGEKISRDMFNRMLATVAAYAVQSGVSLDDEAARVEIRRSALDAIIKNRLLMQAAEQAEIDVDESKVEEQILSVSLQLGEDAFAQELQKNALTERAYRGIVRDQLLLDAYLAQTISTTSIAISDTAVKNFYTERVKLAPAGTDIPKLADVAEQIRQYLQDQERQNLIETHIQELRAAAEIKELLDLPEQQQS